MDPSKRIMVYAEPYAPNRPSRYTGPFTLRAKAVTLRAFVINSWGKHGPISEAAAFNVQPASLVAEHYLAENERSHQPSPIFATEHSASDNLTDNGSSDDDNVLSSSIDGRVVRSRVLNLDTSPVAADSPASHRSNTSPRRTSLDVPKTIVGVSRRQHSSSRLNPSLQQSGDGDVAGGKYRVTAPSPNQPAWSERRQSDDDIINVSHA